MILYHFCATHSLRGILRDGLTMGRTPIIERNTMRFEQGQQWLTAEKNPQKQSWATRVLVPYSRIAVRLTVKVPDSHRKKLVKATEFVKELPPESRAFVTEYEGSGAWYIYRGRIPPAWIVGYKKMEE